MANWFEAGLPSSGEAHEGPPNQADSLAILLKTWLQRLAESEEVFRAGHSHHLPLAPSPESTRSKTRTCEDQGDDIILCELHDSRECMFPSADLTSVSRRS